MFIYSIFGMSFFGYVRKSAGITDLFNFETFPNSMIVLFQMCTTAGWSGVLQALTNDRLPDCDPTLNSPSHNGDCGDRVIAIPFIVSFVIITSLVVVRTKQILIRNFSATVLSFR
jgi:Na+/pantothenate symporter